MCRPPLHSASSDTPCGMRGMFTKKNKRCFSIPGHDITILNREVGHLPGCFTAGVHSPVHIDAAALKARV
ncbi:unnamed protein product [Leuciscus chuanchicus]